MPSKMTDLCYLSLQDWENLYDEWETWVFENYTVRNEESRCPTDQRDGCKCDACLNTEGLLTVGRWVVGKHKGKTPKELNRKKWAFILHAIEKYGTPDPALAHHIGKSPHRTAQQEKQITDFFKLPSSTGSPLPLWG